MSSCLLANYSHLQQSQPKTLKWKKKKKTKETKQKVHLHIHYEIKKYLLSYLTFNKGTKILYIHMQTHDTRPQKKKTDYRKRSNQKDIFYYFFKLKTEILYESR